MRRGVGGVGSTSVAGLMERLSRGVVLGAEGYLFELERRGVLKSGPYVPEVVLDRPEAVAELHREFLHAGTEVMVAVTYYGHEEKLRMIGRASDLEALNRQAVQLAADAARDGGRTRRRQHLQHLGVRPGRRGRIRRAGAAHVLRPPDQIAASCLGSSSPALSVPKMAKAPRLELLGTRASQPAPREVEPLRLWASDYAVAVPGEGRPPGAGHGTSREGTRSRRQPPESGPRVSSAR